MVNDDGNCAGASWMVCALLWTAQDPGRLNDILKILNDKAAQGAFQGLSRKEKVNCMAIVYRLSYIISPTAHECHMFTSLLLGTDWGRSLLCDRAFAVTNWSRCCSHMHGRLLLPSINHTHGDRGIWFSLFS